VVCRDQQLNIRGGKIVSFKRVFKQPSGFHYVQSMMVVTLLPQSYLLTKGADYMDITYLKKIALTLALLFLLQGCALYVRGHDEYYEHHHPYHYNYYHGHWH
jgi:hypothetical protein